MGAATGEGTAGSLRAKEITGRARPARVFMLVVCRQ